MKNSEWEKEREKALEKAKAEGIATREGYERYERETDDWCENGIRPGGRKCGVSGLVTAKTAEGVADAQLVEDREHFRESFKEYVSRFVSITELLTLYQYTEKEMDAECRKAFNCSFRDAYDLIRCQTLSEAKQVIYEVAKQGNGAAIKVLAEQLMRLNAQDDKNNARVTISFDMGKDE